ncbi:MAG TPA: lamin tail domain-containing protein, partial [Verrucomicrobiae bacterium]
SGDAFFNGQIHEFRIYDSALPQAAVATSFAFGPDYIVTDGPPQFPLQPTNRVVNERQSTTFNAFVVGRRPIVLQWYRDGVLIPNATNISYTLPSAAMSDNGVAFQLWATNNVGGTTYAVASSGAVLTVNPDTTAPFVVRVQNVGTGAVEILFSEPVALAPATNSANYVLSGLAVNGAALSSDGTFVTLATDPLAIGSNYTLTISNQLDTAAVPNTLAPNPAIVAFTTFPYALREIGSPGTLGTIAFAGNGLDFTGSGVGAGSGAARTNDQFTLAYQNLAGNFDVQTRLGSLNLSDAWARAGLMARDGAASNALFAATWATPTVAGSFFQWRAAVNGATALAGNFPVNYPNTWLRLRRTGNIFDGFASVDGQNWAFLSSATIAMSSSVQVGLAVSANSGGSLVSQFRDIGAGAGTITTNLVLPFEPLAASSRKTALVFSEIMYNPPDAWGASNNLEWIEIYNTGVIPESLTGHKIRGDVDFDFALGTTIQPGQFLVVARNPGAFAAFYPGKTALGPWIGNLPNNGGTVRLNNELGGRMLEVNYDNELPWPVAADGTGHSIVLRKPSYGENESRAWTPSTYIGGSPGANDVAPLAPTVVINEFLQDTNTGFVELKNVSSGLVDISGYILTDNVGTNRYVFPPSTTIAFNGVLSVGAATLAFTADPTDGHLYVVNSNATAVVDAVEFGAYGGAARGRYPDGSPYWNEMSSATPGSANAAPLVRDLVINEIMYHPISESNNDEFVEIYNRGTNTISLDGWRIRGGIDFNFPSNVTIAPSNYVVVAENVTNLLAKYPSLGAGNTFGNYSGNLGNGGERIALQMPVTILTEGTNGPVTNNLHTTVNEVTFRDGGRWGLYSDGGGSSLELIDPRADNRLAANWADSDESGKAGWTTIDDTQFLLNGQTDQNGGIIGNGAPNRLEFFLQDVGEVLLDNVEIRNNGGANLIANTGFESGTNGFFFGGTHRRTFVQAGVGVGGTSALRIVSTGRGDSGPNKVSAPITQLIVNNPLQTGGPLATNTGTIRAQVRWLKGSPYIMFRPRGHWMETTLRLNIPSNLGTPGAANSRLVANAGPAISETAHTPVLPIAGQPVVVTARIADPDNISSVTLRYRLDSTNGVAFTFTNVTMVDSGVTPDVFAGDGIYSGTIPGFSSNLMVAFHIVATDAAPAPLSATFPSGFPTQECLVRFGEAQVAGGLGTYRLWVSTNNVHFWSSEGTAPGQRERNANDPMDATFVYGANRVVYNVGTLYSGSPFHTLNAPYNGPGVPDAPICDYEVNFPSDDKFLGTEPFVLSAFDVNQAVGTFFADRAVQNEATGNWIGRKLGQQYNHRRHVYVFFNGVRRGTIYEDAQQPNGDMLEEYYPGDTHGELRKIEDWFEYANDGQAFTVNTRNDIGSQSAYLLRITNNSGAIDSKRYRWTFKPRSTDNPNDWVNFTNLVQAVNTPGQGADYVSNTLAWLDMPNFLRPIAAHHICGDWDSYGYERGKNMFMYKPDSDGYRLLLWDIELGLGHSQSRAPTDGIYRAPHEPMVAKMFINPTFQREYLCALLEGCNGPLAPGAADGLLDARYASFVQNNLPVISPDYIKSFITARREYILTQMPNAPFSIDGTNYLETTNVFLTFTGQAPIGVKDIVLSDGRDVSPTWLTVTQWSGNVAIASGTNVLVFRARDANGAEVATATVTVVFTGVYPWPQIRINEWLAGNAPGSGFFDPADNDFDDWFELFNPTGAAVDLNGWYLSDTPTNKLQYHITSSHVLPASGLRLVWADGEPNQNGPGSHLHVNFQLRLAGENIVLTAPDGTIVDQVTFGQQTNNISMGRYRDGSTNIAFLATLSPTNYNYPNLPPTLNSIADKSVVAGSTLTFTNVASDPNVPADALAFSLDPGFPSGASVNPTNGIFTWKPMFAQAPGTNSITVRVTDNGLPPKSAARTFTVTVVSPITVVLAASLDTTNVVVSWPADPGVTYRLESKTNLNDAVWSPVGSNVTAGSGSVSITNITDTQRFYRVMLVE